MPETVHATAPGIYCWEGPKMRMTLFSATLGTLVATDQRVLFLSTGTSDAGHKMAQGAGGPAPGPDGTSDLDLTALSSPDSFEAPLASIVACEAGKKRALILKHRTTDGTEHAHALGSQYGMPGLSDWVDLINSLREPHQ